MKTWIILFNMLPMVFFMGYQGGYDLIQTVKVGEAEGFSVDQFNNIYIINGSELIKYDENAKQLYSFSNPILGDIFQVDVQNPLNPYVFYRDVNQLVIVDNRLNSSTALDFTDYGFLDVRFLSFSDQNNVWFYDQATDKIYRFNMQFNKVSNTSLNITQISGSENLPQGMLSTIDQVFLNVPDKGVFVFDAVGAFQKLIPLKGISSFDVKKKRLVAIQSGKLIEYDLITSAVRDLSLAESDLRGVKVVMDRIYLLTETEVRSYREK